MIINITGKPHSGKTYLAEYIAKNNDMIHIDVDSIFMERAKSNYPDNTDEDIILENIIQYSAAGLTGDEWKFFSNTLDEVNSVIKHIFDVKESDKDVIVEGTLVPFTYLWTFVDASFMLDSLEETRAAFRPSSEKMDAIFDITYSPMIDSGFLNNCVEYEYTDKSCQQASEKILKTCKQLGLLK